MDDPCADARLVEGDRQHQHGRAAGKRIQDGIDAAMGDAEVRPFKHRALRNEIRHPCRPQRLLLALAETAAMGDQQLRTDLPTGRGDRLERRNRWPCRVPSDMKTKGRPGSGSIGKGAAGTASRIGPTQCSRPAFSRGKSNSVVICAIVARSELQESRSSKSPARANRPAQRRIRRLCSLSNRRDTRSPPGIALQTLFRSCHRARGERAVEYRSPSPWAPRRRC